MRYLLKDDPTLLAHVRHVFDHEDVFKETFPEAFEPLDEPLVSYTLADAAVVIGRPLTEAETERLRKTLEFSSMGEAFSEVVYACADRQED